MNDQKHIRVLLVDDEQDLTEYMSKLLLKKGFIVKAVFSGEEALNAAKDADYDVAVVDLKMPGIDGLETQKRLRDIQPFLQCIVLTGHGSIKSALQSGHEDAFEYFLKPVDNKALVDAIEGAYKKKQIMQGNRFRQELEKVYMAGLGPHELKEVIRNLEKLCEIDVE